MKYKLYVRVKNKYVQVISEKEMAKKMGIKRDSLKSYRLRLFPVVPKYFIKEGQIYYILGEKNV
jgi:hypothetical protein